MARQMNHNKVNMQKRIARETLLYDGPPNIPGRQWSRKRPENKEENSGWLKLRLRKHRNKSLPEIAIYDPGYLFGFLYGKDVFFEALKKRKIPRYEATMAYQLEYIVRRAQRILPPVSDPRSREFLIIVDKDDIFENAVVVKKGGFPKKKLKKGSRILMRAATLDTAIPYHWRNVEVGMRRMSKVLKRLFFGDTSPDAHNCDLIFLDATKFVIPDGLSSNILPTGRDLTPLIRKYLRSLRA